MSMLAKIFAPLRHRALEKRRESVEEVNERATRQVLRDELDAQYQIVMCSPIAEERSAALDEIDRIEALLR